MHENSDLKMLENVQMRAKTILEAAVINVFIGITDQMTVYVKG